MMKRHIPLLGCAAAACALCIAGPIDVVSAEDIGAGAEDAAVTAVAHEMPQEGADAAATQAAPLIEAPAASGSGAPAAEKADAGALVIDPAIVDKAMSSYSFTMKQLVRQAEQNLARVQKVLAERAKRDAEKAAAASTAGQEQAGTPAAAGGKPAPQADAKKPRTTRAQEQEASRAKARAERDERERERLARREAYEKTRQERAAQRQAAQAAACVERRKCEVERKARRDEACAERSRQEADRKARTALTTRPVEAARTTTAGGGTGDLSPAVVACVSAAGATPDQFLAKQAMQERAIACEQVRFAGEWARRRDACHRGIRDTSDPAALMARQDAQEAAIAREQARFAADNRQCAFGQVPRVTAADMARAQEKYGVSSAEDIAEARAYAATQGACRK